MSATIMKMKKDLNNTQLEEIGFEILNKFYEVMDTIAGFWEKLGISDEQQKDRCLAAKKYVITSLIEMEESEQALFNDIANRVETQVKKLHDVAMALGVNPVELSETMGLFEKDIFLQKHSEDLNSEKERRMNLLKDLRETEEKLCKMMEIPIFEIPPETAIPTDRDLNALKQHVRMLQDVYDGRFRKFRSMKMELITIMETMELEPATFFEREVICYEDDQFILSAKNLKELDIFAANVQSKKVELEKERDSLLKKLSVLWNRLNIAEVERRAFMANHTNTCRSTILSIREEIDKYQELKMQSIGSYIELVNKELGHLYVRCYAATQEREQFRKRWDGQRTEEALEAYEMEVQRLKNYEEETKEILLKIQKREQLWELMTMLEQKSSDPNRFANRGGKLLQEEKERKRLQRELPKSENELFQMIEKYEEDSGKPFLFYGENLQDYIREQWEQRLNEKENEKILRQKQRTMMQEQEVTMGSPLGKRGLPGFEKSTPSKLFKRTAKAVLFSSPTVSSRMRVLETVGNSPSCRTGKRVDTMPLPSRPSINRLCRDNVLKVSNGHTNCNKSLDSTTYSQFAKVLDHSNLHSSLLSSCKVPTHQEKIIQHLKTSDVKTKRLKNSPRINSKRKV